jgi:hypothetical protein
MKQTRRQAAADARMIEEVTGNPRVVFEIPVGSAAYKHGLRFSSCDVRERDDYERDGAIFQTGDQGGR